MNRRGVPWWALLASNALVLGLVAGYLALDATTLHWVAPSEAEVLDRGQTPEASPTPAVDRVVGVIRKCNAMGMPLGPAGAPLTGDDCNAGGTTNDRKEVTIHTVQGSSFVVEVATNTRVSVGMEWPP